MTEWYHVTPLFLLGNILEHGGLRCGSDLDLDGLPRRQFSREEDDQPLTSLGGARPADCVMLFKTANSNLLRSKMESRGGRWKAFPHVVIHFSPGKCLKSAGGSVFGSVCNVGRSLKRDETPDVRRFTSYTALGNAGVQEVMIPVTTLPNKTLSIAAATSIQCFSQTDQEIVEKLLSAFDSHPAVTLTEKEPYIDAQREPPASEYIELTRQMYGALEAGDRERHLELMLELAHRCFD